MKKYLIDINIFLEILLCRKKENICSSFLNANIKNIYIFDFSLHAIGVLLFRNNKYDIFKKFITDIHSNIVIISLYKDNYNNVSQINFNYKLDFDDSYQSQLALDNNLEIVTLDKDFKVIESIIEVKFL